MDDELRIRPCAEFTNIHSFSVSGRIDSIWDEAVQKQVSRVDQGEHEAEQSRNCNKLGEQKTGPRT